MKNLYVLSLLLFFVTSCGNNEQTPAKTDTADSAKVVKQEPAKPIEKLDPDDTVFELVRTVTLPYNPQQYSYKVIAFSVFPNGNMIYSSYGKDSIIRVVDPSGKTIRSFGQKGKTDNTFEDSPNYITIGNKGEAYIQTGIDSRIRVFDSLGNFVRLVKVPGAGATEMSSGCVMNAAGELFVTLSSQWLLKKFDASGNFAGNLTQIKSGSKKDVWGMFSGIGIDSAGNLYVMNNHTEHDVVIHKCGPDGSYISTFAANELTQFGPMTADAAGRVFAGNDDGVVVYDNSGKKVAFIEHKGASWNDRVRGIQVDARGYVYLLCNDNQVMIYR